MIEKKLVIQNPTGLAVRPAGVLSRTAMNYPCRVTLIRENFEADAKSVLAVLAAAVRFGETVTIRCEGPEEDKAMEAITQAIEKGLGEM